MSFKDLLSNFEKELSEEIGSAGKSIVQYLTSNEKYLIKFVMPEGQVFDAETNNKFWKAYDDTNKDGTPCKAFLVPCVIVGGDVKDHIDKENVRYVKFKVTALKMIWAMFDAWEVMNPNGPVFEVKVLRDQPWFSIQPSATKGKFNSFDSSKCKYPDLSLDEAAEAESNKNTKNKPKSSKVIDDDDKLPF